MNEKPTLIEQLWGWHNSIDYTDLSARLLNAKLIEAIVDLTHRVEDLQVNIDVVASWQMKHDILTDDPDASQLTHEEEQAANRTVYEHLYYADPINLIDDPYEGYPSDTAGLNSFYSGVEE